MGYGKKTDFATGRTLDLDKSYKFLIKPAVTACGVKCIRADEIRHAGVIDVPMYEQLLDADVVVADLSTANPNALYELGVRHALRPRTTVVIAEDKMVYPFDVNHTVIQKYVHLGDVIDIEEALRFTTALQQAVEAILAQPRTDSPVYTFLPTLAPPSRPVPAPSPAPAPAALNAAASGTGSITPPTPQAPAVSELLAQAEAALSRSDYVVAKALYQALQAMKPSGQPWTGNDTYLLQRLALATYKSKLPTPIQALEDARQLLEFLSPASSNDTETLGLWGSIHKRLWELKSAAGADDARTHLDEARLAYERGYWLRNDYYNGINLAFLLNVRAAISEPAEAIADFVQARRVRKALIPICAGLLTETRRLEGAPTSEGRLPSPLSHDESRAGEGPGARPGATISSSIDREADSARDIAALDRQVVAVPESHYWVLATLAEAHLGLGDEAEAETHFNSAAGLPDVKGWMVETTREQLAKLKVLLTNSPLRFIAPIAGSGT